MISIINHKEKIVTVAIFAVIILFALLFNEVFRTLFFFIGCWAAGTKISDLAAWITQKFWS